MNMYHNATDLLYKMMLKDVIDELRRDLRIAPLPDSGSGTSDGDDGDDEEQDRRSHLVKLGVVFLFFLMTM